MVKNRDKEKYVNSEYGITFDSAGSWSLNNDTARNVIIFGVDNSLSYHSDNHKKIFLGPTFGINGSFGSPEKEFSIYFSKANTKFCFSLHYDADNSYCLLMEIFFSNLKPTMKILTFQLNFVLEVYLMDVVLLSLEKYL